MSKLPEGMFAMVSTDRGTRIVLFDGMEKPERDKTIRKLYKEYGEASVLIAKPVDVAVSMVINIDE